jgi:putative transposase
MPQQTEAATMERIVEVKRLHHNWGAKKLLKILRRKDPARAWPACSTVSARLKREGLVVAKPRRTWPGHAPKPQTPMKAPNEIWTVDYKGAFKTGDGIYCYPLTVADGFSRYLLGCQGHYSTATGPAKAVFLRLFREYGLPRIIRSDNAVPFATTALGRRSRLSVWWIKLGIKPELNDPAHPEQNGRHERMHRTLKAETTRPPRANLNAQQRAFNEFRREYNEERPHEAL